ncbi:MAG: P-loop NTPase [Anaerolineae bacterium]|uniref:P-loop NTPase n=1 Tax=Candidatus Flexifilum breve TaxID=3140694 RepID=UPI001AD1E5AE|nr:P-loop NTPase [Chloroflexota bacterium]MBK9746777.1 P-loop NTPase [Chloroflexota bacterium]MBN8635751.1 P-loop NTPase [Anaerolineae bacterium]
MMNPFPRARLSARHIVMVVSAKGGVGKSTVTVNLAAALTARGLKVGIFDADLHAPNIPALLGVRQSQRLSEGRSPAAMFAIDARPDAIDMRPLPAFQRYGIGVMSLGLLVGDRQAITPNPAEVGNLIALLMARIDWGDADVLLIDMPPGTGEPLNTLLDNRLVDAALLVALRENLSHLDNGRLISVLKRKLTPILGVVENMTHVVCPNCGEHIDLYPAPAAEQAVYGGAPVLGAIPFHPHLIRQNRAGKPIPLADPTSPAAVALLALADEVITRMKVAPPAPAPPDDECIDCP